MLDLSTLALFTAAAAVLTAAPEPDMLLIASRSLGQGRMAGVLTYAGIATGSYLQAFAAAFGLSQLFILVPTAYDALRWLGAIYLAWTTLRSQAPLLMPGSVPAVSLRRVFLQGLWTNLLNPKMALFMLALLPQFLKPELGSIALQIIVLATILNVMGLLANGVVILAASRISQAPARLPQRLMGMVFGGLALRLAFASRD